MNKIDTILKKTIETNYRLSVDDTKMLFDTQDENEINAIKLAANNLRYNIAGDKVSYIRNLNVNFTNICDAVCLFCGFRRSESESDSYVINLDEFEQTLFNAKKSGVNEVCLQGGLHSNLKINGLKSTNLLGMYGELLSWVKEKHSDIHMHAYSPEEIEFLSIISDKDIKYVLEYLKDHGLDSMPGTAAEILVDDVRKKICSKKLNTKRWKEVIIQAHKLDIPSTCTIMFGHIENNYHRAQHLAELRQIQDLTGGFTEFIPLPFIANKTLLNQKVNVLKSKDRLKMLAISRLFFKNSINNIQSSWVKQGMEETAESLDWGVNDIGGTLGDEKITHAAGGTFGRGVTADELIDLIKSKDRTPIERDTLYKPIPAKINC
ncbi:MAG: 5-amino-6-(D-ribitylamino)uracil--L-tyrosine 4-hydroxyphenyl transferase CofH [bacterium]